MFVALAMLSLELFCPNLVASLLVISRNLLHIQNYLQLKRIRLSKGKP